MFAKIQNSRGMTLAELTLVIALLGILTAMAVPSFTRHLPTIRFRSDVRDVASVFKLARVRAVAENVQFGVLFDGSDNPMQYIVFVDENEDEIYTAGSDEVIFNRELSGKTELRHVGFANDTAIFKTDGSSNGGWISLGLAQRNDSLTVDILPSTGRVKVIQ